MYIEIPFYFEDPRIGSLLEKISTSTFLNFPRSFPCSGVSITLGSSSTFFFRCVDPSPTVEVDCVHIPLVILNINIFKALWVFSPIRCCSSICLFVVRRRSSIYSQMPNIESLRLDISFSVISHLSSNFLCAILLNFPRMACSDTNL